MLTAVLLVLLVLGLLALRAGQASQRKALAASEAHLNRAQRLGNVGSFGFDPKRGLVVSDEMYRILGLQPGSAIDRKAIAERIHAAERASCSQWIDGLVERGGTDTRELRVIRPDGSVRRLSVTVEAVRGASGAALEINGTAIDSTDRRRAELEYAKLFQAVEQSPVTVVVTDSEGIIEYVNPAFSRITGYAREEVVGRNPRQLPSGAHPARFYTESWRNVTVGKEWRGQIQNRRKSGEVFWEDAVVSPVQDGSGRTTHYIAVKEDITERKRAEEALRSSNEQLLQSQKVEAIGRLAGGVAHDFNNILNVILGHSELALRTLAEADPRRRNVLEIRKASERAANLTRQLLAFSRRQVLQPRVLVLNAVIHDVEKMLRPLIGEDVELVTDCEPALGSVLADPGQLEQVILNLAVNARDAMPHGGRLSITTRNVAADAIEPAHRALLGGGRFVLLSVSDAGAGMSDEVQKHIFEPFFTTKPPGKGTGLGLSTVYGIVKQSDGFVFVKSASGRGTTFDIYLPRVEGVPEATEAPAPAPEVGRGDETVLLVEDNEALRELTREMLEMDGYHVLEAETADHALELASQHPVQLLLTDIVMPQLNGRELARRIEAIRPGLKVLYMSGYSADVVSVHGVLETGLAFLPKPFTPSDLAVKVREVLGTR